MGEIEKRETSRPRRVGAGRILIAGQTEPFAAKCKRVANATAFDGIYVLSNAVAFAFRR